MLVAAAIAMACLVGCGGKTEGARSGPPPVSTTTDGWKVYRPARGGYEVSLPTAWETVDASTIADTPRWQDPMDANPEMAAVMSSKMGRAFLHSPGALLAFEGKHNGTNVYIYHFDLGPSAHAVSDRRLLRFVAKQYGEGLKEGSASGLTVHGTTLDGRPAVAFTYDVSVEVPGVGRRTVESTEVLTLRHGVAWFVHNGVQPEHKPDAAPIFDRINGSFSFL